MEPPAVVSPRKDSLLLTAKEGQKSQLLREIQNRLQEIKKKREEKMRDVRSVESTCEVNSCWFVCFERLKFFKL